MLNDSNKQIIAIQSNPKISLYMELAFPKPTTPTSLRQAINNTSGLLTKQQNQNTRIFAVQSSDVRAIESR